jgi:hypothetical protein
VLSFTTPDGRTVQQAVGSRKRPVRARSNAQVTVFHVPDDPSELVIDGHGVRGRAYTDIVLGLSLAVIVGVLVSRVA